MYTLLLAIFSQDLKLPAEIQGQPNQFITVIADTPGEVVRFVALDSGLSVFPADLLSNKKATVVTGPAGRYRILAYSAVGGKPTDPAITTIIIGNAPNPPFNPPGPQPKPNPMKELEGALQAIYGALNETGRETQTKLLASIYRQGANDLARHTNIADVYNGLQAQAAVKLQPRSIIEIRKTIAADMRERFGDKAEQALTDDLRRALAEYFNGLAGILEGLI